MAKHLSTRTIYEQLGLQDGPRLLDARRDEDFERVPRMIPGSMRFAAERAAASAHNFPPQRPIALYSSRTHDLGQAAQALAARGLRVSIIEGGIEGWLAENRPTIKARTEFGVPGGSQWVTRERPKIDRIACPWLIRRFIDPLATFFYVPAPQVRTEAIALGAQPYDIPDVTFSHRGPKCSFDAFLDEFDLHDPVMNELARIIRAADTGKLDESREAPGLLAISLGLSASISDDQLLLEQGMAVYDALYTWCKTARDETHSWPQKAATR
jgi:rhodanese-related sulfurtransferase